MPKYWWKQIFAHGRFPEVGRKQKTEREEKKRLNDGNNNGQATHGARKHAWRTQAAWATRIPWSISLFFFSLFFSPSFAFDPLRGISRVRNNFSPNILA